MSGDARKGERGSSPFPHLFAPIDLGPGRSKNRVMRVATTSNLAERSRARGRMRAFYRRVAMGGAGVIVSEAVRLHPADAVVPSAIPLFDPGVIPGMRKISSAIHDAGALFIVQLNHGGRQHLGRRVGTLLAPSDLPCPRSGGTPHAMTTREVEEMVEFFISAAINARDAHADGVEIHGAQGHLIGQFVSPYSNRREDRYGGSFENRMRFPLEILRGVRQRLGPSSIVGYRLGVEEFTKGGLTIDDTCEVAALLVDEGLVDYISLSQGNFNTIETHLPDRHYPQLVYRDIQRRIKAAVGDMIVIQSTRIQTPGQAEEVIASGDGDMVGLCRALIVDPDWPVKAQSGRAGEIRRCIACNQCWDWISGGEPIACATNPTTGREHLFRHTMRVDPGTVVVVGGGPAGLEAARVSAERGYRTVLFEREDTLGGKFVHAPLFPSSGELAHVIDWLVPAARRTGVDVRLGVAADVDAVLAEQPHAAIVAAGATPFAPEVPSDGTVPVLAPVRPKDIAAIPEGGSCILMMDEDGYFWSATVAEAALDVAKRSGRKLVIATRFFEVLRELPMVSRIAALRLLDAGGTSLMTSMSVDRIENGAVVLSHYLSGREVVLPDVTAVFWVGRQSARGELFGALKAAGLDRTCIVGDAFAPRRLPVALLEGHAVARQI
ncbi:FAD-dependent oxidoreductase [Acuticoccus sp.]|uniref:oxidoreductase n=1 Tax=Acuticoccus sp. TaxID=1904378 RepID=UPI003B52A894